MVLFSATTAKQSRATGASEAIIDVLAEVGTSIARNKLRVALTGFSVAFGILMLIILLAAGNGLLNGVMYNYGSHSHNITTVYGSYTSRQWHGLPRERRIRLDVKDTLPLRQLHGRYIQSFQPRIERSTIISSGAHGRSVSMYGYAPHYIATSSIRITHGRWLNQLDMNLSRKVAVISSATATAIFPGNPAEEAVGRMVRMDSLLYTVVGIYTNTRHFGNDESVFIPYNTMTTLYNGCDRNLSSIVMVLRGLDTAEANDEFTHKVHDTFAHIKDFDPDDHGVWVWSEAEDYLSTKKIFDGLGLLIWIIGIASLVAGVVGVSNIMLITVRERTREFGIRKAIGARPASIVRLVIVESVSITLLFGYIGMLAGIWIMHFAADALTQAAQGGGDSFVVFRNPHVDMGVVMAATLTMVLAGLIAGYMPALRAVRVKPVEALAA